VETATPPAASETLLVVDYQDMVREFIVESLREYGYKVFEARNGAQALQLIESHGPGIDLMVTDIVMPGMGGKELAARANAACSSIKVLFMTGYAHGSLNGNERPVPGDEVILKPFAPEALESRVRGLLHAESGSLLHAD
jgi:CheY-like chemotaxis protein